MEIFASSLNIIIKIWHDFGKRKEQKYKVLDKFIIKYILQQNSPICMATTVKKWLQNFLGISIRLRYLVFIYISETHQVPICFFPDIEIVQSCRSPCLHSCTCLHSRSLLPFVVVSKPPYVFADFFCILTPSISVKYEEEGNRVSCLS